MWEARFDTASAQALTTGGASSSSADEENEVMTVQYFLLERAVTFGRLLLSYKE